MVVGFYSLTSYPNYFVNEDSYEVTVSFITHQIDDIRVGLIQLKVNRKAGMMSRRQSGSPIETRCDEH